MTACSQGSIHRTHTRGSHGFTLIELLVVIAIIAILAAILFPVFAKARERGKATTCLSNLKQIGTGLAMYADDYEGVLPRALSILDARPGYPQALPQVLSSHTSSLEIFHCPSDAGNKIFVPSWPDRFWKENGQSYSFPGPRPNQVVTEWQPHWRSGRPLSQFREPSVTGLMSDLNPWHKIDNKQDLSEDNMQRAAFNVLYADWHVRQTRYALRNDAMLRAP
jgi:prepilin-type N-terminal cleavage/methylation domain-containing protein/prepilin-type processing-associated H-X9-DG protein